MKNSNSKLSKSILFILLFSASFFTEANAQTSVDISIGAYSSKFQEDRPARLGFSQESSIQYGLGIDLGHKFKPNWLRYSLGLRYVVRDISTEYGDGNPLSQVYGQSDYKFGTLGFTEQIRGFLFIDKKIQPFLDFGFYQSLIIHSDFQENYQIYYTHYPESNSAGSRYDINDHLKQLETGLLITTGLQYAIKNNTKIMLEFEYGYSLSGAKRKGRYTSHIHQFGLLLGFSQDISPKE